MNEILKERFIFFSTFSEKMLDLKTIDNEKKFTVNCVACKPSDEAKTFYEDAICNPQSGVAKVIPSASEIQAIVVELRRAMNEK